MNQERVTLLFPDEAPFDLDDNGVAILDQDFPIPDGALPVRMQTGDLPVTIIGWIADAAALPGLLRNVADETEKLLNDSAETPD
jgi:hypothetical protein